MIDEERLKIFEKIYAIDIDERRLNEVEKIYVRRNNEEGAEVIRLARLGLWAEKHGVNCIKKTRETWAIDHEMLDQAIAALPQ
jgi:hypothetical protein